MKFLDNKYKLKRHDLSKDKSLRAWSAADEYLLHAFSELEIQTSHFCIYNDRFGFLACNLHSFNPSIILTHKSQEKANLANFKENSIPTLSFSNPLETLEQKIDFALLKIPKSLALFQVFLEHIAQNSTETITVVCSFMTRHFSPKLLQIAEQYFDVVEQSKAVKKARLITLSKKKKTRKREWISELNFNGQIYKQYGGVFSGEHIDYATQFFLNHLELNENDACILDLASGNGVIGNEILKRLPNSELHLVDDSFLAVESAKLNVQGQNVYHHFNNDLSNFEDATFDLIVTNPPFHFEYEINIQIPLYLFKECKRCLKKGGNLQIVANRHLNYKVHLEPMFFTVKVLAENEKFVVYHCLK